VTTKDILGSFHYKEEIGGISLVYDLILNEDSTFSIGIGKTSCDGVWILTPKNEVLLKCGSLRPLEALSIAYMKKREYRLKVLNPNELQMDSVILKRISSPK